jgi:hypothetical protein
MASRKGCTKDKARHNKDNFICWDIVHWGQSAYQIQQLWCCLVTFRESSDHISVWVAYPALLRLQDQAWEEHWSSAMSGNQVHRSLLLQGECCLCVTSCLRGFMTGQPLHPWSEQPVNYFKMALNSYHFTGISLVQYNIINANWAATGHQTLYEIP